MRTVALWFSALEMKCSRAGAAPGSWRPSRESPERRRLAPAAPNSRLPGWKCVCFLPGMDQVPRRGRDSLSYGSLQAVEQPLRVAAVAKRFPPGSASGGPRSHVQPLGGRGAVTRRLGSTCDAAAGVPPAQPSPREPPTRAVLALSVDSRCFKGSGRLCQPGRPCV